MNKNAKILVVGHGDVVDRSLVQYFSRNGYSSVFSSESMGLNPTIQPSVYELFAKEKFDYVFLASTRSGGIQANLDQPAEFIYHNLESQNNIIYASWKFGVKKLLYFASSCIYPRECPQPMKEESFLTGELEASREPYAVAKIAGVKLCQAFRKQYGFNAVVVVPTTLYGPECDVDLEKAHVMGALIAKFARAAKDKAPEVVVWGTGKPCREFLYADDFINACMFVMEKHESGQVLNVGSGVEISISELAETIARVAGYRGKIVFDTSKPDGAMHKLLDSGRINQLGWRARIHLDEGISKTYQWYKMRDRHF